MDSEEDVDELTGYHSVRQGPAPIVLHSTSKAEEAAVLAAHIKEWTQGEEDVSIGVLTRANQRGEEIAGQLGEHDVAVSAGRRTSTERPVAVMTMHNAKGLEFTHVILLDVNAEALPQRYLFKGLAPPKPTRRSSASVHCSTLRLHVPAICCWSAWWGRHRNCCLRSASPLSPLGYGLRGGSAGVLELPVPTASFHHPIHAPRRRRWWGSGTHARCFVEPWG